MIITGAEHEEPESVGDMLSENIQFVVSFQRHNCDRLLFGLGWKEFLGPLAIKRNGCI